MVEYFHVNCGEKLHWTHCQGVRRAAAMGYITKTPARSEGKKILEEELGDLCLFCTNNDVDNKPELDVANSMAQDNDVEIVEPYVGQDGEHQQVEQQEQGLVIDAFGDSGNIIVDDESLQKASSDDQKLVRYEDPDGDFDVIRFVQQTVVYVLQNSMEVQDYVDRMVQKSVACKRDRDNVVHDNVVTVNRKKKRTRGEVKVVFESHRWRLCCRCGISRR